MNKLKSYFTKENIKSFLHVCLGVLIVAFAYTFFLKPNDLVIGGVSGIGVMVKSEELEWLDSAVMFMINMGLLVIALIFIGKGFFMKTVIGSLAYPVFTFVLEYVYEFLQKYEKVIVDENGVETVVKLFDFSNLDLMLVIIFSSIIMGYGLGYAMKHGGSTGGTEVGQVIFYEKFHFPYSLTLYILDGTVILIGFFVLSQTLDLLFYEVIFAVVSGVIMDVVIFGGLNKRGVYIISEKCDEIKQILLDDFERGVTSIKVVGEYSKAEKNMLMCLLSSIEYNKLRDIIEKIDPNAFYFCVRASEVRGLGFSYGE